MLVRALRVVRSGGWGSQAMSDTPLLSWCPVSNLLPISMEMKRSEGSFSLVLPGETRDCRRRLRNEFYCLQKTCPLDTCVMLMTMMSKSRCLLTQLTSIWCRPSTLTAVRLGQGIMLMTRHIVISRNILVWRLKKSIVLPARCGSCFFFWLVFLVILIRYFWSWLR